MRKNEICPHCGRRRVAQELRELGLYPEGDLNAYLRTYDAPKR